jgi:hypothetical protein
VPVPNTICSACDAVVKCTSQIIEILEYKATEGTLSEPITDGIPLLTCGWYSAFTHLISRLGCPLPFAAT